MTGDFFTEWSDKLDVSGAERRGGDGLPVRCFPLFLELYKDLYGVEWCGGDLLPSIFTHCEGKPV